MAKSHKETSKINLPRAKTSKATKITVRGIDFEIPPTKILRDSNTGKFIRTLRKGAKDGLFIDQNKK